MRPGDNRAAILFAALTAIFPHTGAITATKTQETPPGLEVEKQPQAPLFEPAPPPLAPPAAPTSGNDPPRIPDWVRDASWYDIYVPRFCNGSKDNDPPGTRPWTQPLNPPGATREDLFTTMDIPYGGDLQGVRAKLTYVRDLGFNSICLGGVFVEVPRPAPGGHRWRVSPQVSLPDTRRVQEEEAARTPEWTAGDRLLLDVVREAHALQLKVIVGVPVFVGAPRGAPRVIPENWRSPLSLGDALADMQRWLKPVVDGRPVDGVDGFCVALDRDTHPDLNGAALSALRRIAPEAVLVGHTWDDIHPRLPAFPVVATGGLRPDRFWFTDGAPLSCAGALRYIHDHLVRHPSDGPEVLINVWGSKSDGRFLSCFPRPQDQPGDAKSRRIRELRAWRLTLAMTMCYPHSVWMLYGDEVGMTGEHGPSALAPMWWVEPDAKEAPSPDYRADFRALVRLMNDVRARYAPLRRGDFKVVFADDERRMFAFSRTWNKQTVIVVVNASNERREAVLEPGLVQGDMVAVIRPELEPLVPRSQQPAIDPTRPVLAEPKLRLAGNRTLVDPGGRISLNLDPMSLKLVLVGGEWSE